jgi:hypothetical protein
MISVHPKQLLVHLTAIQRQFSEVQTMRVIVPWIVLGTLATVLIGCGNNFNSPQNYWNVVLTSNATQTETLNFSFFANMNGTSLTGSGLTFAVPTPCFGNSANPSGVTITGQVNATSTPGLSGIVVQMQYSSGGAQNTLSMQGQISNGFGTTTGQGTYFLTGNTTGCATSDSGTFFLQTAF